MYASKSILVLLTLLVVFVAAHPIQHVHHKRVATVLRPAPKRRGACRPRTGAPSSTGALAAGPVPTPVVIGDGINSNIKNNSTKPAGDDVTVPVVPPVKDDEEPASTSTKKVESSSTAKPKPTSTKEEGDKPVETSTKPAPPSGGSNGKISALFPASTGLRSWSTSSLSDSPLPLSDGTLRPTRLISTLSHDYVSAPDGKKAMKAHYPKGSYTFTHQPQGGLSFYAPGPSSVDLSTAKEATFGYSVYFPAGFGFQKGGKLPGICKSPEKKLVRSRNSCIPL
jgi:hypothetical protein